MGFKVDNTADINEGIKEVPKGLERLNTGKVRSPTNESPDVKDLQDYLSGTLLLNRIEQYKNVLEIHKAYTKPEESINPKNVNNPLIKQISAGKIMSIEKKEISDDESDFVMIDVNSDLVEENKRLEKNIREEWITEELKKINEQDCYEINCSILSGMKDRMPGFLGFNSFFLYFESAEFGLVFF